MFENLNSLKKLQAIEAKSFQELVDKIASIPLPTSIVFSYSDGKKHYAAVLTNAKIVQKKKEK